MCYYFWQTGGDVSPLTLGCKLFQVLQCNLFVPRAVCQAVIDYCVLKGEKHMLVTDAHSGVKGATWTWSTRSMWVLRSELMQNVTVCVKWASHNYLIISSSIYESNLSRKE